MLTLNSTGRALRGIFALDACELGDVRQLSVCELDAPLAGEPEEGIPYFGWDEPTGLPHADAAALRWDAQPFPHDGLTTQPRDNRGDHHRSIHVPKTALSVPIVKGTSGSVQAGWKSHTLVRMGRRAKRHLPPGPPEIEVGANFQLRCKRLMAWRIDVLCWLRWADSGKELERRIGVSERTVSSWRTGSRSPELHEVALIAHMFGLTIDFLYLGSTKGLDNNTLDTLSHCGLVSPM